MPTWKHLVWIVYGAATAFGTAFLFGDRLALPVDLYYLVYAVVISSFFALYVYKTNLNLGELFKLRIGRGLMLGSFVALVMVNNVFSQPPTEQLTGNALVWAVFWRGVVYGLVDGFLLTVFPWVVVWRAFRAESKSIGGKIVYGLVAWLAVLGMTSAYHLGYEDFRSEKLVQANIGNSIMSVPTIVAGNPVGSPIAHVALHVSAVLHVPETELYLPPHRVDRAGADDSAE